jgi:hypothetical protein
MLGADIVVRAANYGLQLVDALTLGPIVGSSAVVELSSGMVPYLADDSRWVFTALPAAPATFQITADFYVPQTLKTGGLILPDPVTGGPGFLATVTMMPRTGYPFPPTLTRVVAQVRLGAGVDPTKPPVPNAVVTLIPLHGATPDLPVTLATTDDGQFTYWFLPEQSMTPPVADHITVHVKDGSGHVGNLMPSPFALNPGGVIYAPTITLP